MLAVKSATCCTVLVDEEELLVGTRSVTPVGGVTVTEPIRLDEVVAGFNVPVTVIVTTPLDGRLIPDQTPVRGS